MMTMRIVLALALLLWSAVPAAAVERASNHRPQLYAVYKAHKILPETLKYLVGRNSRDLYQGLGRGLATPVRDVNEDRIIDETKKIAALVDARAPFSRVVWQMGFVSGLLALHIDPSRDANAIVKNGFPFYLNAKLGRCRFVFDGYRGGDRETSLRLALRDLKRNAAEQGALLEKKYRAVGDNSRFIFDERSAVFGVSSVYFSNLARYSAHLWHFAWREANGDLTRMPFKGPQTSAAR